MDDEIRWNMMTSSNGNIFRVTGHLCGEFTVPRWIPAQKPVTRSFDLRLNKRLSIQSWGWWFETLSHPLWRHRNEPVKGKRSQTKSLVSLIRNACNKFDPEFDEFTYNYAILQKWVPISVYVCVCVCVCVYVYVYMYIHYILVMCWDQYHSNFRAITLLYLTEHALTLHSKVATTPLGDNLIQISRVMLGKCTRKALVSSIEWNYALGTSNEHPRHCSSKWGREEVHWSRKPEREIGVFIGLHRTLKRNWKPAFPKLHVH